MTLKKKTPKNKTNDLSFLPVVAQLLVAES